MGWGTPIISPPNKHCFVVGADLVSARNPGGDKLRPYENCAMFIWWSNKPAVATFPHKLYNSFDCYMIMKN